MVSKISKATGSAQSAESKKIVVPREDPVLRAQRLLDAAIAKAKATAEGQLTEARAAEGRAKGQLERWTRISEEATAKVAKLESDAGLSSPNAGQDYEDALTSANNE